MQFRTFLGIWPLWIQLYFKTFNVLFVPYMNTNLPLNCKIMHVNKAEVDTDLRQPGMQTDKHFGWTSNVNGVHYAWAGQCFQQDRKKEGIYITSNVRTLRHSTQCRLHTAVSWYAGQAVSEGVLTFSVNKAKTASFKTPVELKSCDIRIVSTPVG